MRLSKIQKKLGKELPRVIITLGWGSLPKGIWEWFPYSEGYQIHYWGDRQVTSIPIPVSKTPSELVLVRVSVKDLRFNEPATYPEILQRAKDLGFEPCPLEAGPQLRRQYRDQPVGDRVLVGTEPVYLRDLRWPEERVSPYIFHVSHEAKKVCRSRFAVEFPQEKRWKVLGGSNAGSYRYPLSTALVFSVSDYGPEDYPYDGL